MSRRAFRVKLRRQALRGLTIESVTMTLNGRRLRVLRGRRIRATVVLRGLPSGRFVLRIRVELSDGQVLKGTRRYRTCTRRKPRARAHRPL